MKTVKLFSLFFLLLVVCTSIFAQRNRFSKEDIEKLRSRKISFITEKLQLTPTEAQKFWPIYNMAEKENWDNQNKRNEIEFKVNTDKGSLSDKEIIDLTKQMVETYKTEGLMREKYNKKYLEVLPPKKVLKLYQSEQEFYRHMFDDFRNRSFGY